MKLLIYDEETLKSLFLITFYNPDTETWNEFSISKNNNQIDSLIRFLEDHKDYYLCGFNNLRFDSIILEWIIRNYENWHELASLEISYKIWQKAQDVIDDANYDIFPEYREDQLTYKQIDLFKIHHLDNMARRSSLKAIEFFLDLENIEEMPIHHSRENLTDEEIGQIKSYCRNDVFATYELYKLTIGDTELLLYKGNNQIELRQDIEAEFNIKCLNYSDGKIGDEIIKKYYCQEKGIKYRELPKKGFFRKEVAIKHCIAPYVEFKTPDMKEFLKRIKTITLATQDDFKEKINFYGNVYSFMKGGLHTENCPKIFESDEENLIIDWDVSSYYPAIIINNGKYPYHLGKEFLKGYKQMFEKRLELKPLAKKDKKIKGIVGALKLAVNVVYGKSSDMQSWIYDKQLTMFTCITGELCLMMLIEAYELEGIHVISANTDGVTVMICKDKMDKMFTINKWWQEKTLYELERTDYKKITFSTVNDYIAVKTDGEVKKKGDFLTDFEVYKNKSARICPIALEKYYTEGIPVEETIKNHKNIYDFALRQKASKDFHYEGKKDGNTIMYNKLIRYYVSKTGEKLFKVKNPSCVTNAAPISQVDGEWVVTVCNMLKKDHPLDNIDFDYYIEKCYRIINKIKLEEKKSKALIQPKNQISLFG